MAFLKIFFMLLFMLTNSYASTTIKTSIKHSTKASIKRGAKFFAANCMSCHNLKYLRYNRLAKEAGITIQDKNAADLSLIVKAKGDDWIYKYLNTFDSHPTTDTDSLPTSFDDTLLDVANFLSYAAKPFHAQERRLGGLVILYLLIVLTLGYFMKINQCREIK